MRNSENKIIIVGAGVVGLSLANALAKAEIPSAIVDVSDLNDTNKIVESSLRVSAISFSSKNILKHVGAWRVFIRRQKSRL